MAFRTRMEFSKLERGYSGTTRFPYSVSDLAHYLLDLYPAADQIVN